MQVYVYNTPQQVIEHLAAHTAALINKSISLFGRCNLALSGGSSPKKLYELLASAPYNTQVDWAGVYFFFGDERFVPFDHPDNNGRMAKEALFDPLNISEAQIFYINTTGTPQQAAAQYQQRITEHLGNAPIFDLILLGLGDNAHTASLFPHTPVLYEEQLLVSSVYLQQQQTHRVTFTAPLINHARAISFLAFGQAKAAAVKAVLEGEKNIADFPAQLIQPSNGRLHWFLDAAAASQLQHRH